MGAELIPVLLQPLLRVELRRPPGALELIKLTLGFREATPELVYVAFRVSVLNRGAIDPALARGPS